MKDINDDKSIISHMTVSEARELINSGTISGGMIPKVECCIEGVEKASTQFTSLTEELTTVCYWKYLPIPASEQ